MKRRLGFSGSRGGTTLDYGDIATAAARQGADTFATRFDPSRNNFDLLRVLLAITVVFCHCFSLKGLDWEPIGSYSHYGFGGVLAVYGFLVISGFLVTRSLQERSVGDYVFARIARVVPGLALISVVEVFVIGLAFTKERTWIFVSYVGLRHLWNMTVFSMDAQLYGVFPDTSPPWMMNGSLWTIPIECSFYIILPIIMVLFGVRRAVVPLFFVSMLAWPAAKYLGLSYTVPGLSLFTGVHAFPFIDFASYFLAGSAAWVMRERVPFSFGLVAISLIGLYAGAAADLTDPCLKLFLPYIVLYFSMTGGVGTRLKRAVGDLSYGIYLFGYPVTLSVIAVANGLSVYSTFAVAMAITLGCAWLSWHFVEQPCLRLKTRLKAYSRYSS